MEIIAGFKAGVNWVSVNVALPVHHFVAHNSLRSANFVATNTIGKAVGVAALSGFGGLVASYLGSCLIHSTPTNSYVNTASKVLGYALLLFGSALAIGAVGILTGGVGVLAYATGIGLALTAYSVNPGDYNANILKYKPFTWIAAF